MLKTRKAILDKLDDIAKTTSELSLDETRISENILRTISDLYESAKAENTFKNERFESAYHSPITGDLEFFIARILYHFSDSNGLGWKVFLRRQVAKCAPDIRIEFNGRTRAVIEVKAKVGWIQSFFSPERFAHDLKRFREKDSTSDPNAKNLLARNQLNKYFTNFQLANKDVFLFLPTLAHVHRKKYLTDLDGYYEYFAQTSGLPGENLILLSNNISLDLSKPRGDLMPTGNFEFMLRRLQSYPLPSS